MYTPNTFYIKSAVPQTVQSKLSKLNILYAYYTFSGCLHWWWNFCQKSRLQKIFNSQEFYFFYKWEIFDHLKRQINYPAFHIKSAVQSLTRRTIFYVILHGNMEIYSVKIAVFLRKAYYLNKLLARLKIKALAMTRVML